MKKKITGSVGITRRSDGCYYITCRDEDASIERLKQVKGLPKVLMAEMSAYFIEGERA